MLICSRCSYRIPWLLTYGSCGQHAVSCLKRYIGQIHEEKRTVTTRRPELDIPRDELGVLRGSTSLFQTWDWSGGAHVTSLCTKAFPMYVFGANEDYYTDEDSINVRDLVVSENCGTSIRHCFRTRSEL
jgi:hypothetical protein